MLPRNSKTDFVLSAVVLCFMMAILPVHLNPAFADENPVIDFYQKHISVVDGNRCPMHPSCSNYAKQAFEKHGVVIGWVMTLDRLVRCGRCEAELSDPIVVNGHRLIHDPVEANDFWWFKKEKKQ